MSTDRSDCAARDRADPLAPLRERFDLPPGQIYLDGNSLGPLPRGVAERVADVVARQWGRDLIRSWNLHDWIDLPARVGARIGRIVGAEPGSVVCADSTSVNLFKVVSAALSLRPGRGTILSDTGNFPTDLYIAGGAGDGRARVRTVLPEAVAGAIDADTAIVMLTHVDYRTGRVHDMAAITRAAHAAGALAVWDLAHSAGALPVDLGGCGADFAVGCSYKYLNGGPGAPAWLYVSPRHQAAARSPLSGWLGHASPFAFDLDHRPADGVRRFLCGTPPILSMAALDAALDVFDGVDVAAVRAKSMALGDLFITLVDERCGRHGFSLACPRDATRRGSQVSLRHRDGYAIVQALAHQGVVGDFRAPDVLRFGLCPLFLRYVDIHDAVARLAAVMDEGLWKHPRFNVRGKVT